MEGVLVGCGQITWSRGTPREQVLKEIAQAGYEGAPAGPRRNASAEEIVETYTLHGLKPAPGYLGADFWSEDQREQILERARQLARDLVGVSYPVVHTNCVLTNRNLDAFPELFRWILDTHKQTADKEDPFYNDLFPHVIPVGGDGNGPLRPSAQEFRRFFEKVWPKVCQMWDGYQEEFGVPKEKRGPLFGYFSNPFLRVDHQGGLDAYVKACAEGCYGRLALARHCYVAPTQASVSPNGEVYRCGSHAIRSILPIGNVPDRGVLESIREGVAGLDELPQEETCYGCALATLYINQAVEKKLREMIEGMIAGPAVADDVQGASSPSG